MSLAFVFPGQGSQSIGMGKALATKGGDLMDKLRAADVERRRCRGSASASASTSTRVSTCVECGWVAASSQRLTEAESRA